MQERDTEFCARMFRHAAIGAILGGPVLATAALVLSQRYAESIAPGEEGASDTLIAIVGTVALLLGVWIGATVGCALCRTRSAEDTCYGGMFGCLVYVVGGVLGSLVGRLLPGIHLHPIMWYLIGGTFLAFVLFCIGAFSPFAKEARNNGNGSS